MRNGVAAAGSIAHDPDRIQPDANCHLREKTLQHGRPIFSPFISPFRIRMPMATFLDRLFGFIDRYFDDEWLEIWQLDDL